MDSKHFIAIVLSIADRELTHHRVDVDDTTHAGCSLNIDSIGMASCPSTRFDVVVVCGPVSSISSWTRYAPAVGR